MKDKKTIRLSAQQEANIAVLKRNPVVLAAKRMNIERSRMLDRWAEGDETARTSLWRSLHEAGDAFEEALRCWKIPRL